MFRRNPNTSIADSYLDFIANLFCRDGYPATFWSVMQRVPCEIGQYLHGAVFVGEDMRKVRSQLKVQRDAFGFGMGSESFGDSPCECGNIQRSNIQLISAGFDAAEFLQIIYETIEAIRLSVNLLKGFIGGGQNAIQQTFHRAFDGGERCAEFVTYIADQTS